MQVKYINFCVLQVASFSLKFIEKYMNDQLANYS